MSKRNNQYDTPEEYISHFSTTFVYGPGSDKAIEEFQKRKAEMFRDKLEELSIPEIKLLRKMLEELPDDAAKKETDPRTKYVYYNPSRGIKVETDGFKFDI